MGLSASSLAGDIDAVLAGVAAASLLPLAGYILVSGFDDLILDVIGLWRRARRHSLHAEIDPEPTPEEKTVAIFVPCWREADVIAKMLRHNLASISYANYEVFVGAYPNDLPTVTAVQSVAATHPRLHLALAPHDGPTSKADCLNWIYQRMCLWEEQHGRSVAIVAIHDAEDLIHPSSLALYNRYADEGYGMMQLPVLALPAPSREWTYGIYCDDFAESQSRHLESRNALGAFLPGCGVGTAFRRDVLRSVAEAQANRIFDPESLTEDYDIGMRLHRLGVRQLFIPLAFERKAPVATREYFPARFAQAVRQRSRWVTGNSLQAWERFGWGGSIADRWFLWRDRKGLWGNALSLYCNLLLTYGLGSALAAALSGAPWRLGEMVRASAVTNAVLYITTVLFASRLLFRMTAVAEIYGVRYAAGVPVRMVWGNVVNCAATARALYTWAKAHAWREPLVWIKTEHAYPTRGALVTYKRLLGEILVSNQYCSQSQVRDALETKTERQKIGERLVEMGAITEERLYEAIAMQQSMSVVNPSQMRIAPRVARALPASVLDGLQVLPFSVEDGEIFVAGPSIPDDRIHAALQRFTTLEPRFHLITPSNYAVLRSAVFEAAEQMRGAD